MVASALCGVAVYVLFASAQQCLPTLGKDAGAIIHPQNLNRRRRSFSRDDCLCSCSFDPRDKGWFISLETPNDRPVCNADSYTVSVNGKQVTSAADMELELARDLLDLLSAVLLKDEDDAHRGDNGGSSEGIGGGSGGNLPQITSTTAMVATSTTRPQITSTTAIGTTSTTRPTITFAADIEDNNEALDLYVDPGKSHEISTRPSI